jgi:hypothetical protein
MDEALVVIPSADLDAALVVMGLAWVAILAMLAMGALAGAWTRLRAMKKEIGMFWTIRNAAEHFIELGQVHCPRSGCDVELDKCLGCEHVKEVKGGRTPSVICSPPTRVVPAPY